MGGQIRDKLFNVVFGTGRKNLNTPAGIQDASAKAMALRQIPGGRPEAYSLNKALDRDGLGFFLTSSNESGVNHNRTPVVWGVTSVLRREPKLLP